MRIPVVIAMFIASPALADVTVTFTEGAPTDRFTIASTDDCLTTPIDLQIDLTGSDAGLIFDVTAAGAGVEVFQPFKLVSGAQTVTGHSTLADGATTLTLTLASLLSASPVAFTIDLDDTIGQREITVSNTEIAGAMARMTADGNTVSAPFDDTATATLQTPGCAG